MPNVSPVAPAAALGPGPFLAGGSSPFVITADAWCALNEFVWGVNTSSPETVAQLSQLVPSYPSLKAAAAPWPGRTLPGIHAVCQGVSEHGSAVVPTSYRALQALIDQWQSAPIQASDKAQFDALLERVQHSASANQQAAQAVQGDLQNLMSAIEVANTQAQAALGNALGGVALPGVSGDPTAQLLAAISQIAAQLSQLASLLAVMQNPPVQVIEQVTGGWEAITADLGSLRLWLQTQLNTDIAVLNQLGIAVAINAWQTIATEAQQFSANLQTITQERG